MGKLMKRMVDEIAQHTGGALGPRGGGLLQPAEHPSTNCNQVRAVVVMCCYRSVQEVNAWVN